MPTTPAPPEQQDAAGADHEAGEQSATAEEDLHPGKLDLDERVAQRIHRAVTDDRLPLALALVEDHGPVPVEAVVAPARVDDVVVRDTARHRDVTEEERGLRSDLDLPLTLGTDQAPHPVPELHHRLARDDLVGHEGGDELRRQN